MDVTQEAFIKVHRHLEKFQGSSSFYTWLYRIVVNLSIDHMRRHAKAKNVDFDDSRGHEDDQGESGLLPHRVGPDPQRSALREELRKQVDQALEALSPNHRAVIIMREVEGLSYTEMAEAMQCSKGTIMSRLFHARRNLQAALIEVMGPEAPDVVDRRAEENDEEDDDARRGAVLEGDLA